MKQFLVTLLLLLFTLPVLAKNTILIVGDSLSAGYGIDPKQGWVKLLETRLKNENYNYQVVNASISGDTLSNGLARIPKVLGQYKPDITIIELGANDGLRGLQISEIKSNLDHLVNLAKTAKSKVLILGIRLPPNYGPVYTKQLQQVFEDVATKNKVNVVPLLLNGIDENSKLMQADGIHPNTQAQIIVLDNVWPKLKKLLIKA